MHGPIPQYKLSNKLMDKTLHTFEDIVQSLPSSKSYHESNDSLCKLIDSINIWDLIQDSIFLFDLHKILCQRIELLDVSIKFTVQTNLFYGSIIQFGTDEHRNLILHTKKNSDIIGCFALTEKTAGVTSGMFLGTRADYDSVDDTYVINTGDDGNCKVWISNGLIANYAVIFTNLYVNNKFEHIQPFLVKIRDDNGNVIDGIEITDMGHKHTAEYLDNVCIKFTMLKVDKNSLMNRRVIRNFYCIADRLLAGRIITGMTSLYACKIGVDIIRDFVKQKEIYRNADMETIKLYELPHIRNIFTEFDEIYTIGENMISNCIIELTHCIDKDQRASRDLVERINCLKILCTEKSRDTVYNIQKNLGSQSLLCMNTNPNFYVPGVIAEGETGILRQKLVGDSIKLLTSRPITYIYQILIRERGIYESAYLGYLITKMFLTNYLTGVSNDVTWLENYELVKYISDLRLCSLVQMFK